MLTADKLPIIRERSMVRSQRSGGAVFWRLPAMRPYMVDDDGKWRPVDRPGSFLSPIVLDGTPDDVEAVVRYVVHWGQEFPACFVAGVPSEWPSIGVIAQSMPSGYWVDVYVELVPCVAHVRDAVALASVPPMCLQSEARYAIIDGMWDALRDWGRRV